MLYMSIANLPVVSFDVHINAQMVIMMLNENIIGIINDYY